jgi:hypothetical protein
MTHLVSLFAAVLLFGAGCDDDGRAPRDGGPPFARFDAAVAARDAAVRDGRVSVVDGSAVPDAEVVGDAGRVPDAAPDTAAPGDAGGAGTPTFVAVGYAGRRVRSTDLGQTWTDDEELGGGGDDEFLLRAVEFAQGMFVATGWKIVTSPSGARGSWTERANPTGQWLGGIRFGNQRFVATGGYGQSAWSADGLSWTQGGSLATEASRSLAFGGGLFVSATDNGNWWQSSDGAAWTVRSGGHDAYNIAYCEAQGGGAADFREGPACLEPYALRTRAIGRGVVVRASGGDLERSENGGPFVKVLTDGPGLEAVAFGVVR